MAAVAIKNNIAAVEEQVILDDLTDRISNLPATDEITVENFNEISAKVKEINAFMMQGSGFIDLDEDLKMDFSN